MVGTAVGQSRDPGRPPRPLRFSEAPAIYVATAIMLAAAMVALLWVPSYAKLDPTLGGVPFFYWYSIAWLLANAALQIGAYQLLVVRGRHIRRRDAGAGAAANGLQGGDR